MKILRTALCVLILCLLVPVMLSAQNYRDLDEDTVNAFGISFQAYMTGAMMVGFGQTLAGCTVEYGETSVSVIFQNMSLSILQLEESFGYTTISGSIDTVETATGADMVADLTYAGGPVKHLQWTVRNYEMSEDANVEFLITADGKEYRMTYSDFMGMAE